jgi:prepilin-type N-terminal cleavage/methylation domain-containing protein
MTMKRMIGRSRSADRGFTLVEVLVAAMILVVALVGIATMFPLGYRQIADAGRTTIAVTAARHILEDIGSLPFPAIDPATTCANPPGNLDCFNPAQGVVYDTTNVATLPTADPALAIARRWRYMVAGPGSGFTYTGTETTAWGNPTTFGGSATVRVDNGPNNGTRVVTVTVTMPGLPTPVTVNTILVRMF